MNIIKAQIDIIKKLFDGKSKMVSLKKRIEKLKHENVELKRMFCDLVYDIAILNEKTVSIINEYKTLIEKDSEQK